MNDGERVVALRRDVDPEARFRTDGIEDRCSLALADLTDHDALVRVLNEHEVDAVYHLAAQTIVGTANRSPLATWEANVRGTYTLLEACRGLGGVKRVVVASSDKAYGDHDELPYREDFALQPRYPYDVSKACTDMIARSYANTYDLPVAVTRLANLYGPGDLNWSRIIPDSARALARGERARDPLGRHARSATTCTWRTPLTPTWRSPRHWIGRSSTGAPGTRAGASRSGDRRGAHADRGVRPRASSRTCRGRARRTGRSTASTSTPLRSASSSAGSRGGTWSGGLRPPGSGTSAAVADPRARLVETRRGDLSTGGHRHGPALVDHMGMPEPRIKRYALVPKSGEDGVRRFQLARVASASGSCRRRSAWSGWRR